MHCTSVQCIHEIVLDDCIFIIKIQNLCTIWFIFVLIVYCVARIGKVIIVYISVMGHFCYGIEFFGLWWDVGFSFCLSLSIRTESLINLIKLRQLILIWWDSKICDVNAEWNKCTVKENFNWTKLIYKMTSMYIHYFQTTLDQLK